MSALLWLGLMPPHYKLPRCLMTLTVLAGSVFCWSGSIAGPPGPINEGPLHTVVPLGVDTIRLENSNQFLNLVASAASPELEGVRHVGDLRTGRWVTDAGRQMPFYPEQVSFRISALTSSSAFEEYAADLPSPADANDYLLHLRFRLKIFSGLRYFYISPESVELIGMPADVPYDERIYRAAFRLQGIPVSARILLEVLDAPGNRISRFHFELE
jgi:hypothetical protein